MTHQEDWEHQVAGGPLPPNGRVPIHKGVQPRCAVPCVAAREVGPAREGSQKKPWESSRPELATLVRLLYNPMKTGMVAKDGKQPANHDLLCLVSRMQALVQLSTCEAQATRAEIGLNNAVSTASAAGTQDCYNIDHLKATLCLPKEETGCMLFTRSTVCNVAK
ncbi:MAG: hypothetical protein FRX49_11203 [Trebouxia sp. A1-2]|nr:MAG: hypothetical protein FRX49_11203 [Trebouxia sp. A1-2]